MKKNLVIVVEGLKSLSGNYANSEIYDLVMINYVHKPGTKYPLIKEFIVDEVMGNGKIYDNYLFLDDDIMLIKEDIELIFSEMNKGKWQVGSPAFNPQNMPHKTMQKQPYCIGHETTWIDICSVFMTHEYLLKVLHTFSVNKSGYGLQFYWHAITGIDYFVYDKVQAIHTKPSYYGEDTIYNKIEGGRKGAYQEYLGVRKIIKEEYPNYNPVTSEVITKFYQENVISFPIIYCEDDKGVLIECIKSLPQDSQIIVAETIPHGGKWFMKVRDKRDDGQFITATIYYPRGLFNFSKARNLVKKLATRPVIVSIDADELLYKRQHELLKKEAILLAQSNEYWGVEIVNNSVVHGIVTGNDNDVVANNTPQLRMFKNLKNINWLYPIHEAISMKVDGELVKRTIKKSHIMIDHTGYEISAQHQFEKVERNLMLYLDNIAEDGYEDKMHAIYFLGRECKHYLEMKKELTKGK